jgi:hypothetical protein
MIARVSMVVHDPGWYLYGKYNTGSKCSFAAEVLPENERSIVYLCTLGIV